ncbi:NAD:arginine ADP-ribosyltransferase (macronuclear) [Tetrahymena thermophila SB210]|uniref:NAD(P)(+)--arginine ADP-ribosyltransferase n=1 Tax=Tetrahymena thermophila (strain SB210) TaxID=312017 RepID=Q22N29_TETTS|nr:NAD:arginine ADP-ribosyltransferase [Tetrahymena thermophila SB210]EAR86686.1 NAD:arginine ADP-ribosyltransferase [Tetrahymena thermophila SB210]|eukprot:XP_977281.1 NAD:arginine ADP-ribosyltransferase [Tetrahymena thermophila SB210]
MSKKQLKKKQHELLIEKEEKLLQKKLNKKLIQSAYQCQQKVNAIKILENNLKNSQKTLQQIEQNIQQKPDSYLKLAENIGITVESLLEAIEKGLPENVADIKVEDGPSHFLLSKPEKKIFSQHNDQLNDLIQSSQYIWSSLKLKMPLAEENKIKIIDNFLENLKNVDTKLYSNFVSKISQSNTFQQLQHIFIKEYTGNQYGLINSILTSNDPVKLSAMREYINIAIKAYQDGNVGTVYNNNKILYRNFRLPKDLISLYKQNSFIYFTNMTSTSQLDLESFGQPDAYNFGIKLQISFLDLQQQKKNNLYTGIEVHSLSYYPNENEVLILPYQLFQITSVKQNGQDRFIINLREVDNKIILNNIKTPQHLPTKPSQPADKKKLQEIIAQSQSKMQQKQESLKQEKIQVACNFQQQAKDFIKKNNIQSIKIQDSQLTDIKISSIQDIQAPQEQQFQNNLDCEEEEEKIEESVEYSNNQINFTNLNNEDKCKLLQLAENFDDLINKLTDQENVNNQNIKEGNKQVENILKEWILVNIEEQTSKDIVEKNQEKIKTQEQTLIQQVSQNKNFLKFLNIQKNQEFKNYQFLLHLVNKSYEQINQQALFNDKIPVCLQNKFLQRFALSSQDNFFHKVYFEHQNATLSLQDLKNQLTNLFFNKYPSSQHNYLELTCISDKPESSNKMCNSFLFQTNISIEEMLDLIITLPIKVKQQIKVQKHKYLQLSNQFFDCRGNMNYLHQYNQPEFRGNLVYNFPNICVRLGLSVLNKFDDGNNAWLSMDNSPGEWAVVYTWISEIKLCSLKSGTKNENKYSKQYEFIPQNALQCSQSIENLQKFIQNPILIGSQAFIIAYQCRANTTEILLSTEYPDVSFLDRSKMDTIRPYGIIIKQVY